MIKIKIYPSAHKIKTVSEKYVDTGLNIPLSHINMDYTEYEINKTIHADFSNTNKKVVLPYQEFDKPNIKLFNEFEEAVPTDKLLRRNKDKYIYYPENSKEFTPKNFTYKTTIKKKLDYKISNKYNLNISCVDDPDSLDLSSRLSSILTNPSQRKLLPPNISINNNSLSIYDYSNGSIKENDFIFIESPDGKYYDNSINPTEINIYDFLNNNTNIWLACDIHKDYEYENIGAMAEFKITNPIISTNKVIMSDIYFDTSKVVSVPGVIVHNPFNSSIVPVLVLEYIGKGFVIVSHSNVLKRLEENSSLIYEMLIYAHLNSYMSTSNIKEWITYKCPDYEIINNTLFKKNKFTSNINIYNYFGLKSYEMQVYNTEVQSYDNIIESDIDLINDVGNIRYIGLNNGSPTFEMEYSKNNDYVELEKPDTWKSIYFNNKIYYIDKLHYLIENDLTDKVFLIEKDYDLEINILPFKSSSHNLQYEANNILIIPFIKTDVNNISKIKEATYVVYVSDNIIKYMYKEDYDNQVETNISNENVILFYIDLHQSPTSINVQDMRMLGGGLKEDAKDNYNLLDIGHTNGRPYRKAGTMVITMPKRFEEYKDIILEAVNTYKVAEEYPIIFFEDNIKDGE